MFDWLMSKQEKEKNRVKNLLEGLKKLGKPEEAENIICYSIDFFNLVSRFEDEGLLEQGNQEKIKFNNVILNSGRDVEGFNRTKKGEDVTLDNVYFGSIFGLWTQTARKWLDAKSVYEGFASKFLKYPERYEESPLDKKVIEDFQVRPFLKRNYKGLLEIGEKIIA